jgi:CubicO group peptidase (beta-lactamase class C family)
VFGAGAILGTTYGVPKLDDGTPEGTPNDQITVQHLLEHTSGWALADDPMLSQFDKNQTELIALMVAEKKLRHPPGQIHDYLNFGYCLQ